MGLNESKLNAEGSAVPPKIRPLFVRRYEELRKRRVNSDNISRKRSLKIYNVEEDNSSMSHSRDQSVDETVAIVTVQKLVVPLPETEKRRDCNIGSMEQDKERDQLEKVKHDDDNLAEVIIQIEGKETAENEHQHEEIIAGEDDDEEEEDGRLEALSSPSFRIYCVEPQTKLEEDQLSTCMPNAGKEEAKGTSGHKKSASTPTLRPGNSSETTWGSKPKRPKRKMKFAAVVNFLKSKGGCYYPSCTCTCGYVPKNPSDY